MIRTKFQLIASSESQTPEVSQSSVGGEGEEDTNLLAQPQPADETESKSTQGTTVQCAHPPMMYPIDTAEVGSQDTVVVVMNSETSSVSCLKTENRSC